MNKLLLISFLLFPFIGNAQVEWTEFSIHILSSDLDDRELCVHFPDEQTFNLVEFDRLVEGVCTIKVNSEEILTHNGLAVNAIQQYQVQFTSNKVCIQYTTNDDFWIRFQIE